MISKRMTNIEFVQVVLEIEKRMLESPELKSDLNNSLINVCKFYNEQCKLEKNLRLISRKTMQVEEECDILQEMIRRKKVSVQVEVG